MVNNRFSIYLLMNVLNIIRKKRKFSSKFFALPAELKIRSPSVFFFFTRQNVSVRKIGCALEVLRAQSGLSAQLVQVWSYWTRYWTGRITTIL